MHEINWTAIIITLILTAGFCFIIKATQNYYADHDTIMIEAGYTYEQIPYTYHGEWVKKDNKESK